MRSLSPEEAELWAKVAATIRPVSRNRSDDEPAPLATPAFRPAKAPRAAISAPGRQIPQRPVDDSGLDSHWDRRLRSGSIAPDSILDLHGHSLDQAWQAIDTALDRAIRSGSRVLLLVTGHSRPGQQAPQRGKIRAAVHDWLGASRHASWIVSVRPAHRRHGGAGSLYIILRRQRGGSTIS